MLQMDSKDLISEYLQMDIEDFFYVRVLQQDIEDFFYVSWSKFWFLAIVTRP